MRDPVLASLLRINRQRMRYLRRALAPWQYVGSMHLIVLYAGRNPGASQEDVACFYALDKTSVARDARRLEELGHLERRTAPENRRQYQLFLTEGGRAMIQVIGEVQERFQHTLAAGLSSQDWQCLTQLLERLEENACRPSSPDPRHTGGPVFPKEEDAGEGQKTVETGLV